MRTRDSVRGFELLKELKGKEPQGTIVGIKIRNKIFDLHTQIQATLIEGLNPDEVEVIDINSPEGLDIMRHSCAHALAQAVKRLFPQTKLYVGPTTETGFFYDFQKPGGFTQEDLRKIKEEMEKIKKENLKIRRFEMEREEAIKCCASMGEDLKVEILKEIKDEKVSFYEQGEFVDLCRGPHVISTGMLGAFELIGTSAVHFKDEKYPSLTRIYGVAFRNEEELENYFKMQEELRKRDHRKLGRELELFFIDEDNIGSGLVLWLPKGATVRRLIEDFWLELHHRRGYQLVYTPHIAKISLWETSGHLQLYKDFMFPSMEESRDRKTLSDDFEKEIGHSERIRFQLKPMNCPFHIVIFKSKTRSYRDLPLRLCEFGTVYRYEKAGVLHGLLRVRGFTQDDAHIFLSPDQIEDEVSDVLDLIKKVISAFGFSEYYVYLSTRPAEKAGTDEEWDYAEESLKKALEKNKIKYEIDPGEGVFYGPKIDIKVKDILGRVWQCSTVQLDFNLPHKFSAFYVDKDNKKKQVYIIHRAILGSIERFLGILIEHTAGNFPPWLAPIQVAILSVQDSVNDYAEFVGGVMKEMGLRVEIDISTGERLSKRIREFEVQKIPFMVVLGEREKSERTITIREKAKKEIKTLKIEEGIKYILDICRRNPGG